MRTDGLSPESAEKNPWILEWRVINAEYERTGDQTLVDDFVRRFKRGLFERWGPPG